MKPGKLLLTKTKIPNYVYYNTSGNPQYYIVDLNEILLLLKYHDCMKQTANGSWVKGKAFWLLHNNKIIILTIKGFGRKNIRLWFNKNYKII